jgi:hypothetical protein
MPEDMSHDDREQFERHPDIRGLGVPGIHPHLDAQVAAGVELFNASKELANTQDIPVGATLRVTSTGLDGNSGIITFRRTGNDSIQPNWTVQHAMPDGDSIEEPAHINGAALGGSAVKKDVVLRGTALAYTVVHQEEFVSGADLPSDSPYRTFPDTRTIPAEQIDGYIKAGMMVRGQDGIGRWRLARSSREYHTDLVDDAEVILPELPRETKQA